MINFAICDDEPVMAQELSYRLSQYMREEQITSYCIHVFPSGRALLESECNFDVIFLDIQMECPNGMETARMLRQSKSNPLLIFVTVLKEYVFDAFEVEAFDYFIKPLDSDRFKRTMDRIIKSLHQRESKSIIVQRGTSCEVILLAQILYCEVQGRKIYIHQNDGKVTAYYDRLEDLEQRMDGRFFRCHRSYLVNLAYVRGNHAGQVLLTQGIKIPVSRLRERDLMQALLRYMKGKDF